MYSIPESNIGRRKIGAAPVGEDVTENYEAHVRKLAEDGQLGTGLLAEWGSKLAGAGAFGRWLGRDVAVLG